MANFKNTNVYKVTTKTTVPAPTAGTGTIVTAGISVKGTSTLFRSGGELQKGAWIVSIGADELRQVVSVESDTLAILSNAFSSDITTSTPSIIKTTDLNIKTISVGILSGLTDGEIDGVAFVNNTSYTFEKNGNSRDNFKSFIDPIIIDGDSTIIDVEIVR